MPALAEGIPACEGFRYVFMDSPPGAEETTLRFTACRNIREPSSRPVNCEVIGELDITQLKVAAYEAAENLWEFKKGLIVGASCVIAVEALAFASGRSNFAFRAYNSVGEKVAIDGLQNEVLSGERQIGELPLLESRVPGPSANACSFLKSQGKKDPSFSQGALLAIRTMVAMIHQTRALKADAKLIWQTPLDQRAAKYEEYKRNVARSQKLQTEALAQGFNASRFVYEYLTSGALLDVPIGTTGEIAVVSPDSCIPDPNIKRLKDSLQVLKQAIASGTLPFGKNAPKEKPKKVEEPSSPPASQLPAENPFAFPL
jgi:hypothetical protein